MEDSDPSTAARRTVAAPRRASPSTAGDRCPRPPRRRGRAEELLGAHAMPRAQREAQQPKEERAQHQVRDSASLEVVVHLYEPSAVRVAVGGTDSVERDEIVNPRSVVVA